MTESLGLDGRVVIVTGASRGIGAAVCRIAAGLGAAIVGVARSREDLHAVLADCTTPTAAVVGDVVDEHVAIAALEAAADLGPVWGLVNNAGIGAAGYHPLTQTPAAEWELVMRVNLLAAAAFALLWRVVAP